MLKLAYGRWRRLECPSANPEEADARQQAISRRPDQTVPLRRRWLRYPMVSLADSVELARLRLRPCGRMRGTESSWRDGRDRRRGDRRDEYGHSLQEADPADSRSRWWHGGPGRRAVEPVSPGRGSSPPVPKRRHSGRDRWLSCRGLRLHVGGHPTGDPRGSGARRLDLCGRGRGPHGRLVAGHLEPPAQATLQLHEGSTGPGGRHAAVPAGPRD